ncbi:MAG: nodulation protein NfeD [Ignavibacteriae bacterium]|nr:nodulation protein NfeD [Ignavibacteriota bacterium]
MRHLPIAVFLACVLTVTASAGEIHVIQLDATINPATAEYIRTSMANATDEGAVCLIIELNTPGGLLKSTREIVSELLTARIPVVVYVAPAGAQAASAGAFIVLASSCAAMAPGTNIGAAHPVNMQGGEQDSIMSAKATNDAAAFIRSISEKRHRNVRWAEEAVRQSTALSETEALRDTVIEIIAPTLDDLLRQLDGRTVSVDSGAVILHTTGAAVVRRDMGWKFSLLNMLSDPNFGYIFFMLGLYGLIFELYNPGSVLPGVVGAISIILAFYSMHTLPVNYAGLGLILVGIILFILELKITSYGMLTIAGAVSLFLGSVMLIDTPSGFEIIHISWFVIIPFVLFSVLFFAFALGKGVAAQLRPPTTGIEGLVGETGIALQDLAPDGQVRVHGEIWSATASDPPIRTGAGLIVESVNGLHLTVRSHSAHV